MKLNKKTVPLALALAIRLTVRGEEPELLIADFEGKIYGGWEVLGETFGPGPAQGALPNQMPASGTWGSSSSPARGARYSRR